MKKLVPLGASRRRTPCHSSQKESRKKGLTRADEGAKSQQNEPDAKAILPEPRRVKKQIPVSS